MRFLVDSAKLEEVREAMDMSFVNGVTTNTREMAYNATDNYHAYLKKLRKIARGTIHVQVTVEDAEGMILEGRAINGLIDGVRVKIPVTVEGLKAMFTLTSEGIEVAATAVNTVSMAVLAATSGAASVIPYYGLASGFMPMSPTPCLAAAGRNCA